uniref:Uncharacterized protein n=1 Tax=Lygus hesperus TaxID=30085 RepID=A0A146KUS8_LYGHE
MPTRSPSHDDSPRQPTRPIGHTLLVTIVSCGGNCHEMLVRLVTHQRCSDEWLRRCVRLHHLQIDPELHVANCLVNRSSGFVKGSLPEPHHSRYVGRPGVWSALVTLDDFEVRFDDDVPLHGCHEPQPNDTVKPPPHGSLSAPIDERVWPLVDFSSTRATPLEYVCDLSHTPHYTGLGLCWLAQ